MRHGADLKHETGLVQRKFGIDRGTRWICGLLGQGNNSCLRGAVAQKFQDSRRTVSGVMSRVSRLRGWLGNDRQKPCDYLGVA
jgi:hypothetical protein